MSKTPTEPEKSQATARDGGWLAVPAETIDLGGVLRSVARQWWIVLLTLILFLAGGIAYSTLATKIYQADTRVLIDPRDKQIVGNDVVRPSQGVDAGWVETQVDLATAYTTLKKVVERENLAADPEFGGGKADVLTSFAEHVRASRPAETYVIDIAVSSVSAEKAARLSIAVSQAFIETLTEAKQNSARQANELLLKQIDDLKLRAQDAEQKVQSYRQAHGVVEIDGKPVDEQTLKQLNEANISAKIRADQASDRASRIDAMTRSGIGNFSDALDTLDSPVIQRLKIEYALAMKQEAELSQTLGPRHPKMAALDADVARTRTLILQEMKSLAERARIDADLAKAQVASTDASLAIATRQLTDTSEASVQLRELQGEASIRQDVYKTFVARAQETGLQENLQVADARIISPAQIPLVPDSPKKKIIVGLAGIAGLGIGLSLAIYRGRSRYLTVVPRDPTRSGPPMDPDPLPPGGSRPSPPQGFERTVAATHYRAPLAEIPMPASIATGSVTADEALALMTVRDPDTEAGLHRLAKSLSDPASVEGPAVLLLFGMAASGAIAGIAFGMAQNFAAGGAATLLVDASGGPVTTSALLMGEAANGILDLRNGSGATSIGRRIGRPPIALVPASSAALRPQLAASSEVLVQAVRDRAEGFDRIVVDLGSSCPPELFAAFAEIADDAVMVVDEAEIVSDTVQLMAAEIGRLLPIFRGLVTTRPLAVSEALPARRRRFAAA